MSDVTSGKAFVYERVPPGGFPRLKWHWDFTLEPPTGSSVYDLRQGIEAALQGDAVGVVGGVEMSGVTGSLITLPGLAVKNHGGQISIEIAVEWNAYAAGTRIYSCSKGQVGFWIGQGTLPGDVMWYVKRVAGKVGIIETNNQPLDAFVGTGEYVHIVVTAINSIKEQVLYINGQEVARLVGTGYAPRRKTGHTCSIGGSSGATDFDGSVQMLKIYQGDRLTPSEVEAAYNAWLNPGPSGGGWSAGVLLSPTNEPEPQRSSWTRQGLTYGYDVDVIDDYAIISQVANSTTNQKFRGVFMYYKDPLFGWYTSFKDPITLANNPGCKRFKGYKLPWTGATQSSAPLLLGFGESVAMPTDGREAYIGAHLWSPVGAVAPNLEQGIVAVFGHKTPVATSIEWKNKQIFEVLRPLAADPLTKHFGSSMDVTDNGAVGWLIVGAWEDGNAYSTAFIYSRTAMVDSANYEPGWIVDNPNLNVADTNFATAVAITEFFCAVGAPLEKTVYIYELIAGDWKILPGAEVYALTTTYDGFGAEISMSRGLTADFLSVASLGALRVDVYWHSDGNAQNDWQLLLPIPNGIEAFGSAIDVSPNQVIVGSSADALIYEHTILTVAPTAAPVVRRRAFDFDVAGRNASCPFCICAPLRQSAAEDKEGTTETDASLLALLLGLLFACCCIFLCVGLGTVAASALYVQNKKSRQKDHELANVSLEDLLMGGGDPFGDKPRGMNGMGIELQRKPKKGTLVDDPFEDVVVAGGNPIFDDGDPFGTTSRGLTMREGNPLRELRSKKDDGFNSPTEEGAEWGEVDEDGFFSGGAGRRGSSIRKKGRRSYGFDDEDLVEMGANPKFAGIQVSSASGHANPLRAPRLNITSHHGDEDSFEDNMGLPEGWAELMDENGDVYFHNAKTDDTRWEHPGHDASKKERLETARINVNIERSKQGLASIVAMTAGDFKSSGCSTAESAKLTKFADEERVTLEAARLDANYYRAESELAPTVAMTFDDFWDGGCEEDDAVMYAELVDATQNRLEVARTEVNYYRAENRLHHIVAMTVTDFKSGGCSDADAVTLEKLANIEFLSVARTVVFTQRVEGNLPALTGPPTKKDFISAEYSAKDAKALVALVKAEAKRVKKYKASLDTSGDDFYGQSGADDAKFGGASGVEQRRRAEAARAKAEAARIRRAMAEKERLDAARADVNDARTKQGLAPVVAMTAGDFKIGGSSTAEAAQLAAFAKKEKVVLAAAQVDVNAHQVENGLDPSVAETFDNFWDGGCEEDDAVKFSAQVQAAQNRLKVARAEVNKYRFEHQLHDVNATTAKDFKSGGCSDADAATFADLANDEFLSVGRAAVFANRAEGNLPALTGPPTKKDFISAKYSAKDAKALVALAKAEAKRVQKYKASLDTSGDDFYGQSGADDGGDFNHGSGARRGSSKAFAMQRREHGKFGAFGDEDDEDDRHYGIELPEGWSALTDDNGDAYFHNMETDETRWEHPGHNGSDDGAFGGGGGAGGAGGESEGTFGFSSRIVKLRKAEAQRARAKMAEKERLTVARTDVNKARAKKGLAPIVAMTVGDFKSGGCTSSEIAQLTALIKTQKAALEVVRSDVNEYRLGNELEKVVAMTFDDFWGGGCEEDDAVVYSAQVQATQERLNIARADVNAYRGEHKLHDINAMTAKDFKSGGCSGVDATTFAAMANAEFLATARAAVYEYRAARDLPPLIAPPTKKDFMAAKFSAKDAKALSALVKAEVKRVKKYKATIDTSGSDFFGTAGGADDGGAFSHGRGARRASKRRSTASAHDEEGGSFSSGNRGTSKMAKGRRAEAQRRREIKAAQEHLSSARTNVNKVRATKGLASIIAMTPGDFVLGGCSAADAVKLCALVSADKVGLEATRVDVNRARAERQLGEIVAATTDEFESGGVDAAEAAKLAARVEAMKNRLDVARSEVNAYRVKHVVGGALVAMTAADFETGGCSVQDAAAFEALAKSVRLANARAAVYADRVARKLSVIGVLPTRKDYARVHYNPADARALVRDADEEVERVRAFRATAEENAARRLELEGSDDGYDGADVFGGDGGDVAFLGTNRMASLAVAGANRNVSIRSRDGRRAGGGGRAQSIMAVAFDGDVNALKVVNRNSISIKMVEADDVNDTFSSDGNPMRARQQSKKMSKAMRMLGTMQEEGGDVIDHPNSHPHHLRNQGKSISTRMKDKAKRLSRSVEGLSRTVKTHGGGRSRGISINITIDPEDEETDGSIMSPDFHNPMMQNRSGRKQGRTRIDIDDAMAGDEQPAYHNPMRRSSSLKQRVHVSVTSTDDDESEQSFHNPMQARDTRAGGRRRSKMADALSGVNDDGAKPAAYINPMRAQRKEVVRRKSRGQLKAEEKAHKRSKFSGGNPMASPRTPPMSKGQKRRSSTLQKRLEKSEAKAAAKAHKHSSFAAGNPMAARRPSSRKSDALLGRVKEMAANPMKKVRKKRGASITTKGDKVEFVSRRRKKRGNTFAALLGAFGGSSSDEEDAVAQHDSTLPAGWTAHADPDEGTYYHNDTTGETRWMHPKHYVGLPPGWEPVEEDDGTVYFYHAETDTTVWEKPGRDLESGVASSGGAGHVIDVASDDDDLPSGWVRHADGDGGYFYHNDETGETVWDKPVSEESLPPGWIAVAHDDGGTFYHHSETGETRWERPPGGEGGALALDGANADDDLPPNWIAAKHDDGGTFYHNELTGETVWERPVSDADLPPGWVAVAHDDGGTFYHHSETGETLWERPAADGVALTVAEEEALPPGWAEVEHDDGGSFYHHEETGETLWERPTLADHPGSPAQKTEALPPGWIAVDHDDGTTFFHHEATGETLWDRPQSGASRRTSAENAQDLPAGWALVTHDDGSTFYHHAETGETVWDLPQA